MLNLYTRSHLPSSAFAAIDVLFRYLQTQDMVTYEITATVQPDLIEAYENYMIDHHIPDLMETRCFESATFSRNSGRYRIRYEAFDQESLGRYLKEHASRLREDFVRHFPTGVELKRDTWDVITAFFC